MPKQSRKGVLSKTKRLFSRANREPNRLGSVATGEASIYTDQFTYGWSRIGKEYKKPVPKKQPMIKQHIDYMKTFGVKFTTYLGTETYGHVWKVKVKRQPSGLKDELTCKVLSLNTFDTNKMRVTTVKEAVKAMFHEVRVLRRLTHTNIIRLEYVVKVPDSRTGFLYSSACMLMEYNDGNLSNLIQRPIDKLLREDECRYGWFGQIAGAVRYLHEKNVVHMNIKPESIRFVIKNEKVFKLCDFCYAIQFGEGLSSFSNMRLKGKYMAPEVRGLGAYKSQLDSYDTKAADIWSLCVTLISSMIGLEADPQVMVDYLRSREWDNLKYLMPVPPTRDLIDLMIRMTEINPNDRPTIYEVCANQWVQLPINS